LSQNSFIVWDETTQSYSPTSLGRASFTSAMIPTDAVVVFRDLTIASNELVLSDDLHMIYQVCHQCRWVCWTRQGVAVVICWYYHCVQLVCWCDGVVVCWCVGVLVCWCAGVFVCWCVGVLVCWCVVVLFGALVCWWHCVNVLMRWCVDALMCWCLDDWVDVLVLVCWCVGALVRWCVGVLVCWCVGVLVCCVDVLMSDLLGCWFQREFPLTLPPVTLLQWHEVYLLCYRLSFFNRLCLLSF
jgi:hypothetical protein